MHTLARRFTNYLIGNDYINPDEQEEYIYGIEVILGKIINYFTLLLLAIINRKIIEMLVFMIVFFSLRKGTGGFHAKKARNCYIGTIIIYFMIIEFVVPVLVCDWILMEVVTLSAVIIIFLFAPVNHPNLNLDEKEIEACRIYSRYLSVVIGMVILISIMFKLILAYVPYIVAGIGTDAGLLIMAKLKKQEVERK